MTVIWWVRRDLRLADNCALHAATQTPDTIVPLFILDPVLLRRNAPKRTAFFFDALRALDDELRQRGSRLIVREGNPPDVLDALCNAHGVRAIFAEQDYSPYARRRDARIESRVPLQLNAGLTIHHPDLIRKADGNPYTMFTPFSRAWKALPPTTAHDLLPAPTRLAPPPADLHSLPLPAHQPSPHFPASEAQAKQRLQIFVSRAMSRYADDRNRLDLDGTSALSPYLRFGLLSARAAAVAARQAIHPGAGDEAWLNELIWREFYISILYHFPYVLRGAFNRKLQGVGWRTAPDDLAAWQRGATGFPVVDAAMRQLAQTGWMHNHARMIAASFLTKELLINWQEGERWFMEQLIDGDPAANNGGWQWTAGVGTDAAPYFRIFNPVLQSKKFDPRAAYIRRYVPELANVPDKYIHEPHTMPPEAQRAAGCHIGEHYPRPIVERALARQRALAAYKLAQQSS